MSAPEFLAQIRPALIKRLLIATARGSVVRDDFQEQLVKFFGFVEQAIVTGEKTWLDTLMNEWASSNTESDLEDASQNTARLLNRIVTFTFEVARENLSDDQSLDLLGAITPVYSYCIEKAVSFSNEARVAYITNELSQLQQKLERLDRSKSNFISVAAHELKTPLTLIEGYSAMLGDLVPREDGSLTLLQGVHNGIRRLREIVDDMIDVSLIDNSLLSLNFQPIWLNRVLNQLKGEFKNSMADRRQALEVRDFPGSDELIFADPERVYQALRNLLTNAIKYTPDGGQITVDGRILPGFVEVTIQDTGIGISAEDQETIFEKFGQLGSVQLHSSGKTKFKGGGPGLGLPIVKGIVEAHGGAIWVESPGYDEVNCPGTTFHLLLPMRTQPNDPKIAKLFGTIENVDLSEDELK
jgi:signal transduction histidine kinase